MKAKITKGKNFKTIVNYIFSPGEKNKPDRFEWIGGTLGSNNPQEIIEDFDTVQRLRPHIEKPSWQCSLTLSKGEYLSDGKWESVVEDFMEKMEFSEHTPYTIVRHNDTEFDRNPYPYHCIVEIGRYLVGEAGCYLIEVVDIKESLGQKFIIVDGGVHQLLRMSMKKASKYMEVLGKKDRQTVLATLAGKLPTPLDIMVEDLRVPENIEIGDHLVIYNCGAYGFNHSITNFALHNYPAEVAYQDGKMELIRCRGQVKDFFMNQKSFPSNLRVSNVPDANFN